MWGERLSRTDRAFGNADGCGGCGRLLREDLKAGLASWDTIFRTYALGTAAAAGHPGKDCGVRVHPPVHSQLFPWQPREGLLVGPWLDPQMPLQGHALQPADKRGGDEVIRTESVQRAAQRC